MGTLGFIYLSINLIINYHVYNGITLHKRTAIFVWGPASVDRDFAKDETLSNTINHHDGLVTQSYFISSLVTRGRSSGAIGEI